MVDFMDDKQLLGELKRGNNAAFEFLFKSYYPRLRGYAIRFIEMKKRFVILFKSFLTILGTSRNVICLLTYFSSFFYGPQWMSKLSEASLDC